MTDTKSGLRTMLADIASDLHTEFLDNIEFFDVEYRCDKNKEYRSVLVKIVHGGPSVFIDTALECLIGVHGLTKVQMPLSPDLCRRINNYFADRFYN